MGSGSRSHCELAYYTIADAAFFPGAVALLNSLRLAGETAPLFVVDCGLTNSQKDKLSGHALLVPRRRDLHPVLQKATAPLAHPAEVMVIIDADMLVTHPLTPLIEAAASGQIIGFEDNGFRDRYFQEWSALGLGVPRRRPYVNCGLLMFSAETASELLPLFVELQEQLDPADTHFGGASESNPFFFADQDIFNVMLCTIYDGKAMRLDQHLAPVPPFPGIKVLDGRGLTCTYPDGVAPYALHHILKKPWLTTTDPNPFSELFARAVTSPDAPVQLGRPDIPLRFSDSRLAPVDRWRTSIQAAGRRRFRGKLGWRPAIDRAIRRIRSQGRGLKDR